MVYNKSVKKDKTGKEVFKMKDLYNHTLEQVTDFLVDKIANDRNITKSLAKKLLINALMAGSVRKEINQQIEYLMEE